MTAVNVNAFRGAEEDMAKGVALIRAVYDVVYSVDPEDGPALLSTLKAGTRLLRGVHGRLCDAIGDKKNMCIKKASVASLPSRLDAVLGQLDLAAVSVSAAVNSQIIMVIDKVRQEAAVEQVRSAAIVLKNVIEHVETPFV